MTGTVHQNRDYPKFEKNVREDMDYFIISDESMFWSCLFVLWPSLSYCYSLSKTKPVLQGYSREKNLGFEFSNRSRSYPIASSPGNTCFEGDIATKIYLSLLVSMKVKEY
jgi:hypothetical protein